MSNRVYLVILDDTEEASVAIKFASHRAARTGGVVQLLALLPRQDFVAWGSVQATMEAEATSRAEALALEASGNLMAEAGVRPSIDVRQGDAIEETRKYLNEHPEVTALVLATAVHGGPGPLVSHFTGNEALKLSCPVYLVPGTMSDEDLERVG